MRNFEVLPNRSYSARVSGMIKKGPEQVWEFWNLVFNSIYRVIETNDASHINKMVLAALAVGRFKSFSRVVPGLVFFAFDKKARLFQGKIQKNKRDKLTAIGDSGLPVWHELLVQYIEQEQAESEKAAPKDYSMDDEILRLVTKAKRNGKRDATIIKHVERIVGEVAAAA